MSTEITKQQEVSTKWGNYGLELGEFRRNVELEISKSQAELKAPTTYDEIEPAIELLKGFKKLVNAKDDERKKVSEPLRAYLDKMAEPIKNGLAYATEFEGKIKALKLQQEADMRRLQDFNNELVRCEQHYRQILAELKAFAQMQVGVLANRIIAFCLNEGVAPDEVDEQITELIKTVQEKHFVKAVPHFEHKLISEADKNAISEEVLAEFNPMTYNLEFEQKVKELASDYAVQYYNKEEAIKAAKQQEIELQSKAEKQVKAAAIQADIVTKVSTQPDIDFKPFKKTYVLDMKETPENAALLMSAFFALIEKTKDKTTVKKWFNFSVSNAITALQRLKNEDNSFAFQGIKFKEESKL